MAETDRATRIRRELFLRALIPTKPPPAVARQLVRAMRDVKLSAGDVVYERGSEPKSVFFIVRGEVTATDDIEHAWTFGVGAVVGILDMNIGRPRSRTATAVGDVELLEIAREDWLEIFEENLQYAVNVRRIQGESLHEIRLGLGPGGGFPPLQITADDGLDAPALEGTLVECLVTLRASQQLETATVQGVAELSRRAELVRAERGDVILRPGAARRSLYFVAAGVVSVERRVAPEISAMFGVGSLLLGGASYCGCLNEYAVTARTDAGLFRVGLADIDDVAEDHFDLFRSMFRSVAIEREQLMMQRAKRTAESVRPPERTGTV